MEKFGQMILSQLSWRLMPTCFLFFFGFVRPYLSRALFWNSCNSSSYINLDALLLNSSRLAVGFLHKMLRNGSSLNVVTIWWRVTLRLRFQMFKAILPNLSINYLKDSPFTCWIFTRMNIEWYGHHIANCIPNLATKIMIDK